MHTDFIIPTKDTPKPHNDRKVLLDAMKYRYATKKFDPEKIISHGIPLREVHEALDWTLRHWQWER